jgi:hypothetical protein
VVPDFAAPLGPTGAIFAKFDAFGGVPTAAGRADAVADGANAEVDIGLLLKSTLALEASELVGVATGIVLAGGAELVAGAVGLMAGAFAAEG